MNFKKTAAIVAAAGALTALALPALAETSFYGSARLGTYWQSTDKPAGTADATTIVENLMATSRLGVNFSSGDMTGKVELGYPSAGAVYGRLLYGTYKFDFGKVLVGQDYNNYYLPAAQVLGEGGDNVMNNYGSLWDTRLPQLKVTMNNGLYFAAIAPNVAASIDGNAATPAYNAVTKPYTTKVLMPKLNVGYEGKAGNFGYGVGVVGMMHSETFVANGGSKDITSALGYFHGTLAMGAADLKFNLGYGQNTGNMGFTNPNSVGTNRAVYGGTEVKNTTTLEGYVQGGFAVSPTLKLQAGFGYVQDDNSFFAKKDTRMAAFVNAPVTLGKGFVVTPEFSLVDQLDNADNSTSEKTYYAGAKWQMDF